MNRIASTLNKTMWITVIRCCGRVYTLKLAVKLNLWNASLKGTDLDSVADPRGLKLKAAAVPWARQGCSQAVNCVSICQERAAKEPGRDTGRYQNLPNSSQSQNLLAFCLVYFNQNWKGWIKNISGILGGILCQGIILFKVGGSEAVGCVYHQVCCGIYFYWE